MLRVAASRVPPLALSLRLGTVIFRLGPIYYCLVDTTPVPETLAASFGGIDSGLCLMELGISVTLEFFTNTTLARMPILTSEALLSENKNFQ